MHKGMLRAYSQQPTKSGEYDNLENKQNYLLVAQPPSLKYPTGIDSKRYNLKTTAINGVLSKDLVCDTDITCARHVKNEWEDVNNH